MQKFFIVLLRFFWSYRPQVFFPTTTTLEIDHTHQVNKISFFIVAHADDIELFMGREAQHQIRHSSIDKMVFIVLSAGDANRKNRKKPFRKITWWQAREHAHTAAISAWNQHKNAAFQEDIIINQKYLTKITMGTSIVLYNFRLTDADKTTSLAQLVQQQSQTIIDLKHQQSYTLEDIKNSLSEIITVESQKAQIVNFFITDPDAQRNKGDHKDHQATSLIVLDILEKITRPHKKIFGYLTYSIFDKPINLNDTDKENSFLTWTLMGDVLEYYGYKRNDDAHHMQWVGKEYLSFTKD